MGKSNRKHVVLAAEPTQAQPHIGDLRVVPAGAERDTLRTRVYRALARGLMAGMFKPGEAVALRTPMRFVDGAIELPHGSGMGIAVDEAKVRRYSVATTSGA